MLGRKWICGKCLHVGKPAYKKRGRLRTEISGWLAFPLGVPYTLWRIFSKIPVCAKCANDVLIDLNSAVGLRLQAKMDEKHFGKTPEKESVQF